MKLYLSGPMTGIKDHNKEAFDTAAQRLRSVGHEVVNPIEMDHNSGAAIDTEDGFNIDDERYEQLLERDYDAVRACDAIVFIKGWSLSGGAGREGRLAIELGLPLYMYEPPATLVRMGANYFLAYSTVDRKQPA